MSGSPHVRPVPGPSPEWRFPAIERFSLANGMSVVTCHLPDRPVMEAKLVLDAGIEREQPQEAGLATIASGCLTEGTELRSNDDLFEALDSLGAHFEVGSLWTGMIAGISVPRHRLIPALDLLTEVVVTPGFRDDDITRVIRRHQGKLAMQKMMPQQAALDAFAEGTFAQGTRFALPIAGTVGTVSTFDPAAVRSWWSTYGHPSNATAVIVGDLRELDLATVLAKTLEAWVTEPLPLPAIAPQPAAPTGGCTIVDFPQGVQTTLFIGHAMESLHPDDETAFKVALHVLGGYFSSRLVTKLREEKGLTYGLQAGVDYRRPGSVLQIVSPVDQAATGEAVADILDEIATLADNLDEGEVRKAAEHKIRTGPIQLRNVSAVAFELVSNVLRDRPDGYQDLTREQLKHVTAHDAKAAFARYVDPGKVVVGAAGPAARIAEGLEQVLGNVTVVESGMDMSQLAQMAVGAPGVDAAAMAAALSKAQAVATKPPA